MAKIFLITLDPTTSPGPFNIYYNTVSDDTLVAATPNSATKASLLLGVNVSVDDDVKDIYLENLANGCLNKQGVNVLPPTTTTTSTTSTTTSTTTLPPTTTTTSTTTLPPTTTTTSTTTLPPTTTTTSTTTSTSTSTTSTTTEPPTPEYYYYSIRRYDCLNNCNIISPDLLGRSSTPLSTIDGTYYKIANSGFGSVVFQVQTTSESQAFDVDMDNVIGTSSNCIDACNA
jgi:hypothetical protein